MVGRGGGVRDQLSGWILVSDQTCQVLLLLQTLHKVSALCLQTEAQQDADLARVRDQTLL